jgi:peptidoglycan/LPS O-acetylase OafA/YrhL
MADDRIPSLDGLRALSILLVIACHCSLKFHTDAFRDFGSIGVSVFFVISGFLITTLLFNEFQYAGNINLRAFYIRRIFRILPAFYVFLASMALLRAIGAIQFRSSDLVSSALFITDYTQLEWWLGHTWSLGVEEKFYLLWPFIMVAVGPRASFWVAGSIIVMAPFSRLLTYWLDPHDRDVIAYMFHTRVDMLMFGCALALLGQFYDPQRLSKTLLPWRADIVSVVFLLIVSPILSNTLRGVYLVLAEYTLVGLATSIIILCAVRHPKSVLGRLLNLKLFVHIGVLSYSLYLWQELFTYYDSDLLITYLPLNLMFIFAAAGLSYHLVETPFRRMGRAICSRYVGSARQGRAGAAVAGHEPPWTTRPLNP